MTFNIVASLVLLFWIAQGMHTAGKTRSEGYSVIWWGFMGVMSLLLLMPLAALWF